MGNQNKTVQCPHCYSYITEDSRFCHKCGLSLEEQQKTLTYTPPLEQLIEDTLLFHPGESFGLRYRIIEEIGRGGMGRVYKAEDQELGITVALKMIRPEFSSKPRFIQQFKEETLLARSISHENVIRIHDIGEVDEIKFISMDFIKGHNLKELIHTSGTLAVETAINITIQLCKGLSVAHKKGIVHQDLTPRNIMIDNDGRVYIMDFGVAKSVAAQEITPSKGIIGTPPYISPEQAKKEKVDQRSDIYSLGIIIYEMLTGKRPFEAETSTEYIEKHIREAPPLPSKINPLIPPFLEKIILKCLEKDRKKRYQNVEDILKDLEEHKEESRIYMPDTKVKKLWKFAYFIPVILLIALLIYILTGRKEPVISTISEGGRIPLAVMYFENNTGNEGEDYWRQALSSLIIHDLSQSKYIRVLTGDTLFDILKDLDLDEARSYSSEDLKKVASRAGVNHILYGNFTEAEETFRINAMLKNVITGELVGSRRIEGEGEKAFYDAADKLTPWIKSQFDLGAQEIASDLDKDIGEILTYSPEALKLYILGKKYYQEGKYQQSNEAFKEAVKIDPGFALAYRRISINYDYLEEIDQAKKYAQKALSLVDRVSDRDRFLVQGWAYTILEDSYDNAIETYKKLLEYYPDDEEGNITLGAIYRNMEEWDLAIERFNKILIVNPSIACQNLVRFYNAKGLYEKAKEILQDNQHNFFDKVLYHWNMSLIYLCQGRHDLALDEIENALSYEPDDDFNIELMGNIYHIQGNHQAAEQTYRKLIDMDDPLSQLYGRFWLAHLYSDRGQLANCKNEIFQGIKESKKYEFKPWTLDFLKFLTYLNLQMNHLDEALDASNQTIEIASKIKYTEDILSALHFRGLTYAKLNKIDEAENTAEQLKQLIEITGIKKHLRYYYHLMGMIAQSKNMTSQAIEDFKKAISLLPHQYEVINEHAFYFFPLAFLYYQHGELEKAREHFEEIVSLTTGRLKWGDIYAKSYYWMGKIFQEKGWHGKAIENYEKFLQLWEKADSGLPEIEEARKQLALSKKE